MKNPGDEMKDRAAMERDLLDLLDGKPESDAGEQFPSRKEPADDESDFADFFVSDAERKASLVSYSGSADGKTSASREMVELLAFWVADEEYATPIVEIQEIIKLPTITSVPRAHASVLGITSLRGTIVPVVDLRRVLRLDERPITRQSRILVLRADGDPVGLLVDRVTSVVRLENDSIEATPRAMEHGGSNLLKGVGRQGNRLIIILDVSAVLGVVENAA